MDILPRPPAGTGVEVVPAGGFVRTRVRTPPRYTEDRTRRQGPAGPRVAPMPDRPSERRSAARTSVVWDALEPLLASGGAALEVLDIGGGTGGVAGRGAPPGAPGSGAGPRPPAPPAPPPRARGRGGW